MKQEEFELLLKNNGRKNLGWQTNRLKFDTKDIENALSANWVKENKKRAGMNFGNGILQDLFFERNGSPLNLLSPVKCHLIITHRERLIVATVIQWLGTNVGFCWLREALSKAGYDIVKRKDVSK